MLPQDILLEISHHILTPLDILHFALVNKSTFNILRYRVKKARVILELKNMFRYTPYSFLFERHVEWSTDEYYFDMEDFCDINTRDIPMYKVEPQITRLYNLRLSIEGWSMDCTLTDRITPRPGAWELREKIREIGLAHLLPRSLRQQGRFPLNF